MKISGWPARVRSGSTNTRPPRSNSAPARSDSRSEEHTSELQSLTNLVCRLLLEKKKKHPTRHTVQDGASDGQQSKRQELDAPSSRIAARKAKPLSRTRQLDAQLAVDR